MPSLIEWLGFITGGVCVWLTVRQNIWNWPIGIANSAFFLILFWQAHLFADSTLQILYIVLGFVGWYWWLKGGPNKTALRPRFIGYIHMLILAAIGVIATILFTNYLTSINDAAPVWDALTTVGSLIAQYMLTRKYIENWFVWLAMDAIYMPLYWFKDLHLTAIIYAVFFAMCVAGFLQWRKHLVKTV